MNDWKPDQYLQYASERTQPSMDLVSRIPLSKPESVIDIGCGPGNSTQVLKARWPESRICGLDNSPAMIEKAKADYPAQEWILGDAASLEEVSYDLVFSNATLQWIPDHRKLLPELMRRVNPGGALAVQIPLFAGMPAAQALHNAAESLLGREQAERAGSAIHHESPEFYYDVLSTCSERVELWVTDYYHVLPSAEAVVDFIRSTGMRPYLELFSDAPGKEEFERRVLADCRKNYGTRADGRVLFPFRRLFFIAFRGL